MQHLGNITDNPLGVITPPGGWKPATLYKVRVSWIPRNPVHRALLITDTAFNPKCMQGTLWIPETGCQTFNDSDLIHYLEVESEVTQEIL